MHAKARGFTLVELLVVVSILGLLIALTIPAVQSARESARRLECVNHLKQLGIGLGQHQSQYSYYPSGRRGRWRRVPASRPGVGYPYPRQGFYDLLPFLDQGPLYNSFNTSIDLAPLLPVELVLNDTAGRYPIGLFLCPSDWKALPTSPGPSSYRFNVGMLWPPTAPGGDDYLYRPGAFRLGPYSRPQDFTDGLSNTVGLSERLTGSGSAYPNPPDRTRDFWYVGIYGLVTPTSANEVLGYCSALQGTPLEYASNLGRSWDESSWIAGWYNHVAPPNAPIMDCTLESKAGHHLNYAALTARSAHPSGVNALMMDGSVRPIKSSINLDVWRSLGTRSGGEVVDSSY